MGEGLISIGKYTFVVSKIAGWCMDTIDKNNSVLYVLYDTNMYQIRISNHDAEDTEELLCRMFGYKM